MGTRLLIYLLDNGSIDGIIAITKGMTAGLLVGMASVVIMGLCGLAQVLAGSMGAIVCLLILSTLARGLVAYQIRQYESEPTEDFVAQETKVELNVVEHKKIITTTSEKESKSFWGSGLMLSVI